MLLTGAGRGAAGALSPLLDGLVAAWLESPDTSLTADSTGNGHTLTNTGVTAAGGLAVFDGASYLSVADSAFAYAANFTVAGLFTFDTDASHFLAGYEVTGSDAWKVWVNNSGGNRKVGFVIAPGGFGINKLNGTILSNTTEYKFVLWVDAGTGHAEVNDAESTTNAGTQQAVTDDALYIGGSAAGKYLTGKLRRVRFWNRVLTPAERLLATNPYPGF